MPVYVQNYTNAFSFVKCISHIDPQSDIWLYSYQFCGEMERENYVGGGDDD